MSLALFGLGLGWAFSYVAATSELVDHAALRSAAASSASPISSRASPARASLCSAGLAYTEIGVDAVAIGATIAVVVPALLILLAGRRPADRARTCLLAADELHKLVVVADVVVRVVRMGREHEQDGVARIRHCVPHTSGGMWTPIDGPSMSISSLDSPSSTRHVSRPATQTRNWWHTRWACAPRTDSLGTSYTAKIRLGSKGHSASPARPERRARRGPASTRGRPRRGPQSAL